jgi:hypothetical protein
VSFAASVASKAGKRIIIWEGGFDQEIHLDMKVTLNYYSLLYPAQLKHVRCLTKHSIARRAQELHSVELSVATLHTYCALCDCAFVFVHSSRFISGRRSFKAGNVVLGHSKACSPLHVLHAKVMMFCRLGLC